MELRKGEHSMQADLNIESLSLGSRIKNGDTKAFEYFFRKYHPRLRLFAFRIIDNFDVADDIIQDIFSTLWENRESINEDRNLKSFIFMSLRNQCLNYIKRQKVEKKYIEFATYQNISQELFLINFLEENEIEQLKGSMIREVQSIMETLSPQCKKVFELSRFEKLKNKEIAEKLGLNIKTVEKHISNAMKVIRQEMHHRSYLMFLLFEFFFSRMN
ncbi:MAG: RNA polymerase sigma-70 factor [Bacteroidota bacterium]|nr:RNA polymerase sigma-70 factor [Bacteroidota bacterium]MDP4205472.1 RNA polymerase sigma-70 factor [Bacteroidota bacterium]